MQPPGQLGRHTALFLLAFCLIMGLLPGCVTAQNLTHTQDQSVGAIRWDAWTGGPATEQVERTLAPEQFRLRLPWFAEVRSNGTVRIDGGRQEVMDHEIAYAAGQASITGPL